MWYCFVPLMGVMCAGLPMKVLFFVHPYQVLTSPSLLSSISSHQCEADGLQVGLSAKLLLESSSKMYPLSIDPNLFEWVLGWVWVLIFLFHDLFSSTVFPRPPFSPSLRRTVSIFPSIMCCTSAGRFLCVKPLGGTYTRQCTLKVGRVIWRKTVL